MWKRWHQSAIDPRFETLADQALPPAAPDGYFALHMRRYLGCKTRLLPQIAEVFETHCPEARRILDIFAGTGVVASLFNAPERQIIANDFLASNRAILTAWFTAAEADQHAIEEAIARLQAIAPLGPNYYSENYGGRFFTEETATAIGTVRDAIDRMHLEPVVKCAAIASLLYAADASALTCGHFDAYRGLKEIARPFALRVPAIDYAANGNNEVHSVDGNELARTVEADLAYIDPPYNRRQYGTLYHVLENIAQNRKPRLIGKTRKLPLRDRPVSRYSTSRAAEALRDLVACLRARHIILSYNNMRSGVGNSNAIVSLPELEEILSLRGPVTTHRFSFPSFTARRGLVAGHEEYLLYCRVEKVSRGR